MNRPLFSALVAAALSATSARSASAQIGQRPRSAYGGEPAYWVGLTYGYVEGINVSDGGSGSTWQFSYTSQIGATIEKTVQRGVTVGASAGFSTANLRYSSTQSSSACGFACDAKADVTQYMLFVRGGSGTGFHGTYNLEGGVTGFSNFRTRETDDALPPTSAKYDFTFGFGGGIGFGFSPAADVYVAQQIDLVLHPSDGGGQSSAPRMGVFRAGFRLGF